MRYRAMLAVVLSAAALLLPVASAAQAATSSVRFGLIYYNSPGSDTGSNASLNAEFARIKNTGSTSRNLTGWTLRDNANHVYTFGSFRLAAGKSVRVHTGKGTNTATNLYWGHSWYIWNNTGDTAYLRNSAGAEKDTCAWGNGIGYIYC